MLKGILEMIILEMLSEQPIHGYAIISIIRQRFGVYLAPSTIYPLLMKMRKEGYVDSEWQYTGKNGKPIKVYKITDAGRRLFEEGRNGLKIIVQSIILTKH
jgi:DNA-binding PadR family transcriptional regulator